MKKILIIEDDEFLGSVIHEKLQNEGYTSIWAKDGALGLQKFEEERPDLVLLDMMLPTMDGYEILEQRAKKASIKDTPILVISNSGQEVEIDRIKKLGVKEYIVKVQFSPKEVIDKVKALIGGNDEGAAGQHTSQASEQKKEEKLTGIKILMVEDDDFLGDILSRKLSKEGSEFAHVLSGEDALEKMKSWIPHVITLDVVLPGMTGFETLAQIKKDPTLSSIPVIMLSNLSQKEDVERALKLGANEFLVKSLYTLDEIAEKIREVAMKLL